MLHSIRGPRPQGPPCREERQARCCWDQSQPLCHVAEARWLIFNQSCPCTGAQLIKHSLPYSKEREHPAGEQLVSPLCLLTSLSTSCPARLQASLLALSKSAEEARRTGRDLLPQGKGLCTLRACVFSGGTCLTSGNRCLNLSAFGSQGFKWLKW